MFSYQSWMLRCEISLRNSASDYRILFQNSFILSAQVYKPAKSHKNCHIRLRSNNFLDFSLTLYCFFGFKSAIVLFRLEKIHSLITSAEKEGCRTQLRSYNIHSMDIHLIMFHGNFFKFSLSLSLKRCS